MIKSVEETKLYKWLKIKGSSFLPQIDKVSDYAFNVLPQINSIFSNYTVHGISHSINVMEYMYELINNIDELSELEVTLLIYSALLHDIGMLANETEIKDIKSDITILGGRKYSKVFEKYGEEKISLQECIRPVHGKRSKEYIDTQMNKEYFLIPNSTVISFQNEIGLICMAHNEDFEWIEKSLLNDAKKGIYELNLQYIAVLLRIADYLDIDEQRAPFYLYNYLKPSEFSDIEWKQHFVIENYNKIVLNERTGLKEVIFQGESRNPTIHRKLLKYFDLINEELKNAVGLCEKYSNQKYLLPLKLNITNKIQTKGFNFSDLKLSLDYNAVTNLLMGEHIYGDKKLGMRELIQNSIDACKTMQETSLQMQEFIYQKYQPYISIILDKDRKQVSIMDNGSGMSISILKKYFLNVGVSYYSSDDYLLQGRKYSPIGHYGIGFLACFMLSDKVEVKTRYYNETIMNKISFERDSEYICYTYENTPRHQGTEIILDYDQCLSIFDFKIDNLTRFIKDNFLDSQIPIKISMVEDGNVIDIDFDLNKIETVLTESICLNQYLNGIEAYIDCGYKQINFAHQLSDINGYDSFLYNGKNYSLIGERTINNPITDYVKNGKIEFINVPIISKDEEDNFNKAYEVLEDFDEAWNKLGSYNAVNILDSEGNIDFDECLIDTLDQSIIGGYTLRSFCNQFEHTKFAPTHTFIVTQDVVMNGCDKVLPYNKNCSFGEKYYFQHTDHCYIKNVLLSDLRINLPYLIDGVTLRAAIVNINNKEFIPNVSRSNISKELQEKLSYAIGKALHIWILENVDLGSDERELLREFINSCYKDDNNCIKL